jgi:hypothetical protein
MSSRSREDQMSKVAISKTDKFTKGINDNLERFGGIPRADGLPSILKNESPIAEVQEFDAVAFVRSRGIYNLDGKDEYFLREDCSEKGESAYSTLSRGMIRLELRDMGLENKPKNGQNVSEVEAAILAARRKNRISAAGNWGGYFPGDQVIEGLGRALVLDGPKLIQPCIGDFAKTDAFLTEFLGIDQLPYLLLWLREAYTALRDGIRRPGQILLLVGEPDSGKGFLQDCFLKPILGGRHADLSGYLFENDKFNADLFASEFLIVEELPASLKISDREKFGEQLKKLTKAQAGRCRGMHREGQTISTYRRILISCNTQRVKMLPPLDADLSEATMLFRVNKAEGFFNSFESNADAQKQILTEIPAFLHHLLTFPFPATLRGRRYGVRSYMNPSLAEEIFEQERWFMLLLLIDREIFPDGSEVASWQGCATDLMFKLQEDGSKVRQAALKLSTEPAIFGQYLEKLSTRYPDRVEKGARRTAKQRAGWIIHPPV